MLQDLKFADSLDPERTIGEYSYVELADPPEGERSAGWPRLLIENRAYCTRVFRKLHVELAARQDGLQACILEPCDTFPMPQPHVPSSQPSTAFHGFHCLFVTLTTAESEGQCTGVHDCAKDSLSGMVEHV